MVPFFVHDKKPKRFYNPHMRKIFFDTRKLDMACRERFCLSVSLWPWIAALRCLVLCCPCLSAAARPGPRLPMAQVHGVHAQALSVWLCRCCCYSGIAAQAQGGGAFRGVPWRALSAALVFWLRFGRCRCLAEPRKFARLY